MVALAREATPVGAGVTLDAGANKPYNGVQLKYLATHRSAMTATNVVLVSTASFHDNIGKQYSNVKPFWILLQHQTVEVVAMTT